MNALEIVQQISLTLGLPRPTSITDPNDPNVSRILGALNRASEEIVRAHDWQNLVSPCTFTTSNQDGVGGYWYDDRNSIGGYYVKDLAQDFDYFLTDYIYDATDSRRINSSTLDRRDMDFATGRSSGGRYFVFFQNSICFMPAIPAGHKITFYYKSKWSVRDSNPSSSADDETMFRFKEYFDSDLDETYLNEQLLIRGALWKYKSERGLDYAESYRDYEKYLNQIKNQDALRRRVGQARPCGSNLDIPFDPVTGAILPWGQA
ncbi:hypothetical protein AGMMS49543_26610 [Betaproteobacteria bacterium]|nr:hypothetical protein AGMMS49543_26610 [Betaproteobacteria bacterium]